MRRFIDEIVEVYQSQYAHQALSTCIITPNRRAHRYIKKTIMDTSSTGGFMPSIFSIDDFISQHIPLVRIDEVDLTYILYGVFTAQNNSEEIDFDDFLSYASILLHDFNEIDMQMASGKEIFGYLNDAKAIQQWNPDGSPLSPSQKEYLRFYNQLAQVYTDFKTILFEKQLCYQGMGYRFFAENIEDIISNLPWQQMIFAGFNALTKSEETILKRLHKNESVSLVWDVDSYYLNDEMMEAGLYTRKYGSWTSEIESQAQSHFINPEKKINIIGTPGVLGQLRMAAQIMADETSKSPSFENKTVIVPADENLLVPLLNSLSTHTLENANITMGFPIQHSHTYRLAESIIRLHLHATKLSQHSIRFHKDDLLEVWNNELLKAINPKLRIESNQIHQTFVSPEAIFALVSQIDLLPIASVFTSCENSPKKLLEKLSFIFSHLLQIETEENKTILSAAETDALQQILKVFKRLHSLIEEEQKPESLPGFYILYKQLIQGLSQAFRGDIHQGLQIMGLLETRLMDFENVIILSANEDILPASSFSNSFIPSDIKYEFELPGIQEKTAVFAYHFYRLIQRAKNIFLIYSTTKKAMSGGEKSRFIKQLEFELNRYNSKIKIQHQLLTFSDLNIDEPQEISIEKDEKILQKLDKIAEKGISPTKIISYIRCPLQFYFKHIAKVYEPDPPDDIIDERMLGNVIHGILEDFYKPYINQNFPFKELQTLLKNIPHLVPEYFIKNKFKGKLDEGPNYLSLKDTEHYLSEFIKHEIAAAKLDSPSLKILSVEEELQRFMVLENGEKILVKGIADRIDQYNNMVRILDYKTGAVDKKHVKIPKKINEDALNSIFTKPDYDKATQLFIYDWMYKGSKPNVYAESGIVSFRLIKAPYIMLQQKEGEYENLENDFQQLIQEIFNPKIPFEQTDEIKNCSYCIYKNICSRKA